MVFEPLGMAQSSLQWQDSHAQRMVHGHDARGEPQGQRRFATANVAASLVTTAPDYARFLIAVLNGERLKPDTAAQCCAARCAWGRPSAASPGAPLR